MTVIEALQRCALFREFTETGIRIFAVIAVEKSVEAGVPLFAEGMTGESLFIVRDGQVRVTQKDAKGGQTSYYYDTVNKWTAITNPLEAEIRRALLGPRHPRLVNNLEELRARVRQCELVAEAGWFDEEVEAVVQYINDSYYRF